jgi:hypothetical protein
VKDWKAELDAFFRLREQQEPHHNQAQSSDGATAIEEFMGTVAAPAFEEFGAALREHGCRIRLRLGDSNMRIVSEFAGAEEFDYILWAGTSALSAESRADGRRAPEIFQNAKGNSSIADTATEDVVQHLVDRYIALTTHISV